MEKSDTESENPARRTVYVLTIWHENASVDKGRQIWRIHLIDPISEAEYGFINLEDVFQFIKDKSENAK